MMALPFTLLLLAAVVATLGFRRSSELTWLAALGATLYAFYQHAGEALNIAL